MNDKKMCDCNQGRLPCSCKPVDTAKLDQQIKGIDAAIQTEKDRPSRGNTRLPGLYAERDHLQRQLDLAKEPQDEALRLAQKIVDLNTVDPIQIAKLLRERAGSSESDAAIECRRLRQIISQCATACGAAVSPDCSIDLMADLPKEILLVVEREIKAASKMRAIDNHRIELLPEYGAGYVAKAYGEEEDPIAEASGFTAEDAVQAVVAAISKARASA